MREIRKWEILYLARKGVMHHVFTGGFLNYLLFFKHQNILEKNAGYFFPVAGVVLN